MSNEELARRAVACRRFRWLPGMRTLKHGRVIEGNGIAVIDRDGTLVAPALNRKWSVPAQTVAAVPDLTDPATVGCLLALVREAWEGQFTVCGEAQLTPQALVAALEAAP